MGIGNSYPKPRAERPRSGAAARRHAMPRSRDSRIGRVAAQTELEPGVDLGLRPLGPRPYAWPKEPFIVYVVLWASPRRLGQIL